MEEIKAKISENAVDSAQHNELRVNDGRKNSSIGTGNGSG